MSGPCTVSYRHSASEKTRIPATRSATAGPGPDPAARTSSHDSANSALMRGERTSAPSPRLPARDRELGGDDHERVQEEERADDAGGDSGLGRRVHGEHGVQERDRGRDDGEVQEHEADERAVARDLPVAPRRGRPGGPPTHRRHREQHDAVGEKGRRVEQEQACEARRISHRHEDAAREAAESEPDVRGDALARERRGAELGRDEQRQQARLAGQPRTDAGAGEHGHQQGVAPVPDEREQREACARGDETAEERGPRADPVGDAAGDERRQQRAGRARRRGEPGHRERDPAYLVQVDEHERIRRAVSERVDHEPGLEDRDGPRKPL